MDLDSFLGRRSPYADFDPAGRAVGLRWGHGSGDEVVAECIRRIRPRLIIEVGSFEGGSAIFMGQLLRELGLATKIICVDTWLGAPEHLMQAGMRGVLEESNGYPQLYYRFLGNVIAANLQDVITPLPNTSENSAVVLKALRASADLIFIDAAHEYNPVYRDLHAYWELLNDPGILISDDYIAWPEVTTATNDFAREMGLALIGRFGKGVLQKGDALGGDLLDLKSIEL